MSARSRASAGFWELQLFAPLGLFQPQKNLQLSLIPLNIVRPVTPKVAGSSPVAPAISIHLVREVIPVATFWPPEGCNFALLMAASLQPCERVEVLLTLLGGQERVTLPKVTSRRFEFTRALYPNQPRSLQRSVL